jgi:AcrR family transcriptional regulator
MARTQQQRREETVARLLDASIDTIVEVGYARASAKVITKRAQVSDGALFRHFPTMGDFMAETAREAGRRQLEAAAKRLAEIRTEKPTLEDLLTIVRDLTLNSTNTVLYELAVAARTDEGLRKALHGVMTAYMKKIYEEARIALADEIVTMDEEDFVARLLLAVNMFDGAAVFSHAMHYPGIDDRRIPVLMTMLNSAPDMRSAP